MLEHYKKIPSTINGQRIPILKEIDKLQLVILGLRNALQTRGNSSTYVHNIPLTGINNKL